MDDPEDPSVDSTGGLLTLTANPDNLISVEQQIQAKDKAKSLRKLARLQRKPQQNFPKPGERGSLVGVMVNGVLVKPGDKPPPSRTPSILAGLPGFGPAQVPVAPIPGSAASIAAKKAAAAAAKGAAPAGPSANDNLPAGGGM